MHNDLATLQNYLMVGGLLFAIGFIGFVVRRNMIIMFLCAEMMLQGVAVSLVAWGRYHDDWGGQMLTLFIIAVAACEAGLGLALILMLFKKSGNLDIVFWQDLREQGSPAFVDRLRLEEDPADHVWPTLTPSGRRPERSPDDDRNRRRV